MKDKIHLIIFIAALSPFLLLACSNSTTSSQDGSSKYDEFIGNVYVDTVAKISNDKSSLIIIACYWDDIDSQGPYGHISVEEIDTCLDSILRIENYYFNQNDDDLSIKVVINDESKGKCHIKHISNDSIVLEHDNSDLFFTGKNTTTLHRLNNEL
ncbi:MAG: hypothetical protein SPL78_01020 [Bacteroidales bacterium]|nr:hypothetical protein [Bacteroidales bacterium]